ncbi:MAG TPA: hypothetical protein ENF34_00915 [Candidatus Bathyarchaeota archaeon]|nr:hypothetical protein [Candidatus Bathyarchaeota archaeon]
MLVSLFITMGAWLSLLLDMWYAARLAKRIKPDLEGGGRRFFLIAGLALGIIGYAHGCSTLLVPIHIYLLWLVPLRLVASAAIVLGARWIAKKKAEMPTLSLKSILTRKPRLSREATKKLVKAVVVLVVLLIVLIAPVGIPLAFRAVGYSRASYMLGCFKEVGVGSIDIFPEIDPSQLRLTTSEIARSIAEMKKTSAAAWVTSVHLGMYGGELCWIATISEPPLFGSLLLGESNRLREVIVVPVTDATGERFKVVPLPASYGEGLWFDRDIRVHAQDMFPTRTFTRAYLTWSPEHNRLVYITTSYYEVPFGPLTDPMVHVWDPQTGALLGQYKPEEAPDWVVQRWDEKWLEALGAAFGEFRWTADNELNFWNGLPYYSDRSAEPAEPEGLRYQIWPGGELVGVYLFQNKRNPSLLEFVIIARKDGIYLYSLDHLALISPSEAKAVAKSGLPALPDGEYATPLALLYRIGGELYYHIPIFTLQDGRYMPTYFALVRATDRRLVRVSCAELGGVREAVAAAYSLVGREVERYITLNGTLVGKHEYVEGGNTRIWLDIRLENGTVVHALAKVELLDPEDVYLLLTKELGDPIRVLVDRDMVVVDVIE